MRLTEFWRRMDEAMPSGYSRSWARDQVLAELGGRTVDEALRDGESAKDVWRAVCATIPVPGHLRA